MQERDAGASEIYTGGNREITDRETFAPSLIQFFSNSRGMLFKKDSA